jgi:hypothetical protein
MNAGAEQARHGCGGWKLNAGGPAQAGRILPRPVDHVIDQQHGDIIHQQRRDGFVDVAAGAQETSGAAPGGTADRAYRQHGRQQHDHRRLREANDNGSAGQRAEIELAFAADRDQSEPGRQDHRQRAQQDRRCLHQALRERIAVAERVQRHLAERRQRWLPNGKQKEHGGGEEGGATAEHGDDTRPGQRIHAASAR